MSVIDYRFQSVGLPKEFEGLLLEDIFGDLVDEIDAAFPDAVEGRAKVRVTDTGIRFEMDLTDKDGVDLLIIERNIVDREMSLELLVIDEDLQGKGIGKKIHKAQYKLAKKLGLTGYSVHANIDVGGYAWLKYGFRPLVFDHVKSRILQYSIILEKRGDPSWKLFQGLWEEVKDLKGKEVMPFIRKNLDILKPAYMRTDWLGKLDFSDKASLDMYEEYIGHVPKPPSSVDENLYVERQVILERLKSGVARDYEQLMRDLDKQIRLLLTEESLTDPKIRKTLMELRKEVNTLYFKQYEETLGELRSIYSVEDVWNSEILFSIVTLDNWDLALKAPIQATGELLEPFIKDLSTRQIKRLESAILTGRAQGQTITEITRRIRGTKAANYRDGVIRKGLDDARTVVRTSVQHVATRARVASWDQLAIGDYRWVSTLDGQTSSSCRALDNQTFEIDKGPLPPIHPNCRSTVIPDYGEPLGTRSSLDGRVQADTTYYEWLKGRSPEFQNIAIGPTRAKLLRNGGLTSKEFTDLQLNRNFEPLTLDEMRKLKPTAFKKANI